MRARVKQFHSPDADPLAEWSPPDPWQFSVLVQVLAGPSDGDGMESFQVVVCTPTWLDSEMAETEVRSARHLVLVKEWNWPRIEVHLRQRFESVDGASWDELAQKLARIGHWEFEDYRT
jgi:hypothetical protein